MSTRRSLAALFDRGFDRLRHDDAFSVATAEARTSDAEDFASLAGHRYALVVTFRRSGEPVPSPVWCALDGPDRLWFESAADSGKVRRLRNDPTVVVCACSMRGRPLGPVIAGTATVIEGDAATRADAALAANVGWQRAAIAQTTGRLAGPMHIVEVRPGR